jgi:hypothetical protein
MATRTVVVSGSVLTGDVTLSGVTFASSAETIAGTVDNKAITPEGLASAQSTARASELYDTYTSKGTVALTVADSGQTWTLHEEPAGAGATMSIISGALGSADTGGASVAGYVDVDLGAPIKRIGARFFWLNAGTTDGHVAILVWGRSASTLPFPPDSPCHISIGPTGASWGVWQNQAFSSLGTHTYPRPLSTDGTTIYEAEVILDGDTFTVRLPDGHVEVVTDSRINTLAGNYAGFEVFQDAGDHFGRFVQVWADARDVKSYSENPLGALYRSVEDRVSSAMTTTTTATAVGSLSQVALTTGVNNTAYGANTQSALTEGNRNTAVGQTAQLAVTTANDDTAVGYNSQSAVTTGIQNTAVGASSQLSLTTGANNVGVGMNAARLLTTGSSHTVVGAFAGYSPGGVLANALTTAQRHTSVGVESGLGSTAQDNDITTIGYRAIGTGLGATSLGSGANAAHAGAVALGKDTTTTAADQVEIGARHIEMSDLAADPAAGAANSGRVYLKDNGSGTSVAAVRFNTGAVRIIAREAPQTGYTTFSNLATDRTCDANATTVEELADILGTLIEDLKANGIISA